MANRGKAEIELAKLNQQQIAWICGVTSRSIRDWADAPRNSDGTYNAQDFIAWFLKRSTLSDDQREFNNQRERLAAAQAEKVEAENLLRRGELVDAQEMIKIWSDVLMAVRSKLLSLPSKIGPQLVNESDTAIIVAKIRAEVYDALAELSEDQSGVTNGAEAAAASDDIGVVGQLS
jgi:phage terminase Nu1 subunit (DNA packaging protein)